MIYRITKIILSDRFMVLLPGFLILFFPFPIFPERTPEEILKLSDEMRNVDEPIHFISAIEDIDGENKSYSLLDVWVHRTDSRVHFLKPANQKGDKVLKTNYMLWYFTKGGSKPLPLTPRQRLLGNVSIGDIVSIRYSEDYKIETQNESSYEGKSVYRFNLISKEGKNAAYDRIIYYIDKNSFAGLYAEFFSASGKLLKKATYEYKGDGLDKFSFKKVFMVNALKKNHVTTMVIVSSERVKLPENYFNKNFINN
jgi:hypothetical protein